MIRLLLCLMLVICTGFNLTAQCTSQGPYSGNTFANDNSTGNIAWLLTANADSSDNFYTTATAVVLGDVTNYLAVTNFSFSIPSSATICGIEVKLESSATGVLQNVSDNSLKLIIGGTITGNDYAKTGTWPTTDATRTYGGNNDNWGITLTPADVNASGFGVAISADLKGSLLVPTARIDFISIIVYYDTLIPLPVDLINFSAEENFSGTLLKWQTVSEENNDYFSVEKSEDGINFSEIDRITGAGNSQSLLSYTCIDRNIKSRKKYYYRLKQVDFNGAYSYSDIISYSKKENISITSPFTISNNKIIIHNQGSNNLNVNIFNTQGQLLFQTNSAEIPIKNLPKGILIFEISGNSDSKFFKFLNQ